MNDDEENRGIKRKADELEDQIEANKRRKINETDNNEINFHDLPNEIIIEIALFSEALPALLLSLTCSRIYNLLRHDNFLWYSIYYCDYPNCHLKDSIVNSLIEYSSIWERVSYPLHIKQEDTLTADAIDFAKGIIAEDESYQEYFELQFELDRYSEGSGLWVDVSFLEYEASVDYKMLALERWYKFNLFDLWNVQRKCARLWKYKHCTCFDLPDLNMTNEDGEKIIIIEKNDDNEFESCESEDETSSSLEEESCESDVESSASLDEESTPNNSYLTEETCSSFIDEISESENFDLFIQVLSGLIVGQCASPACKHSYQIRISKMFNKSVIVGDITKDSLDQIRDAIDDEYSFEGLSTIVCALQKFSMTDLLTLHNCVKKKFPYLATLCSVSAIEDNIPYVWLLFATHHEMPWSFHFQADFATSDDHDVISDDLSIRHSMLKLFRRSGIYCASPNSSGISTDLTTTLTNYDRVEYAVSALEEYIKSVLGSIVRAKPADAEHINVTEGMMLRALKSPLDNQKNGMTLYGTSVELMKDENIVMYSDSEISSDEDSSFEDLSEEDDLTDFLQQTNTDNSDEEVIDDFKGLNDLIKNSVPGIDEDNSPLLTKSAVIFAQSDVPLGDVSDIVGTEEDDEKEDQEHKIQRHIDSAEYDELEAIPEYPKNVEEALMYTNKNYEINMKNDASYCGVENKKTEIDQDLPLRDISDERRAKIIELRRETNRILKEEAENEFQSDSARKVKRLEENIKPFDPMTCKSMVIVMNCHGPKLRSIIEQAVDIIGNSEVLKTVKLKWHWLEKEVTLFDDNSYSILREALEKCSTLKRVILDDCDLSAEAYIQSLPNVEVSVKISKKEGKEDRPPKRYRTRRDMGQNLVIKDDQNNDTIAKRKIPTFTEANISLTDESIIRPNGYFPPEIIVLILKYADFNTCTLATQACKLWYESIQEVFKNQYMSRYGNLDLIEDDWKVNFYRRKLADQNLAKGLWWAESFSAHHYPSYDDFSYIASFEGNKMIFNVHHIHITSYSDTKFYSSATELDLNTMKTEIISYGTIYANGFQLRTLVQDNYAQFDWKEYEIVGPSSTTKIKRKYIPPQDTHYYWRREYFKMHVNMDGSPKVLTTNVIRNNYNDTPFEHFIEVVDLNTGQIIAENHILATQILGYVGDSVIAIQLDGSFLVNILTNERTQLTTDLFVRGYYCKDSNIFGYAAGTKVKLCHWPSLEVLLGIDLAPLFPPLLAEQVENGEKPFTVTALAFDRSKLVVALLNRAVCYAVYDVNTGTLIQTLYNTSDAKEGVDAIHLAPNGKIVTSADNLVVYDFLSPNLYKDIPVIFAESKSNSVTKTYVPASELTKFAAEKLEAPIETIHHQTLNWKKQKELVRLTGIGSHHKDCEDWNVWSSLTWPHLTSYLRDWRNALDIRNSFQITQAGHLTIDPPNQYGFDLTWDRLRKVLFVYERFNNETKQWEFAEPSMIHQVLSIEENNTSEEEEEVMY